MSGSSGTSGKGVVWRCAMLAALCLTWPALAGAAPKTDTVLLRNGDRLTCEIKRLEQASCRSAPIRSTPCRCTGAKSSA